LKLTEPRRKVFQVENSEQLDNSLGCISKEQILGLDAERASGFRYGGRAYLVQISTREEIFLVDPISLSEQDLQQLAEALNKTWILHSATQDLPCLAELGLTPTSIFDTELAARLCGSERFGLGSIAMALLDLEMEKEHSAADWSIRPISSSMLNYAALDVDVLHELHAVLSQKLLEMNRDEWAKQEFTKLLSYKPKPVPQDAWRNLPGMSRITDETKLRVAASLFMAREAIAKDTDTAPGRLIPDRSILAVLDQMPKSKRELAGNKAFQGRASRTLLDKWWQAIDQSTEFVLSDVESDPNHIPNHRSWERRFPEAFARLNTLRPLIIERAAELGIAVEILLTPDTLRKIAFEPQQDIRQQLSDLGARPWQIEQVVEIIAACLKSLRD
jgi:ribonuclease D